MIANEIRNKDMPKLLAEAREGRVFPVYLFYGDEFLYKSGFKSLLDVLVSPDHQGLNYEAIDGANENVYAIIERLKTFPLIPSAKVIAIHGTRVFYSAVTADNLLDKSKEAFEREDLNESANCLLKMLSVAGMSLDDVKNGNIDAAGAWLDQVVAYCVHEKMTVPVHEDDAEVLSNALLRGFPKTNHLVLTTDLVDKRRKLYKTIKKIGKVIDCSVPKGDKAADKRRQQEALKAHLKETLTRAGKKMAPEGLDALYRKIGPNMRSFGNELEKLIAFVGDRKEISPSDVESVSKRTKQDPIYEMTNAVAERDTRRALFFLNSLLKNNFVPLQVLAAVSNQMRKLILARDFIQSKHGGGWRQDLSYPAFQKIILPELGKREPDFLTSKAHPFVIYMALKQSGNYTLEELIGALEVLLEADIRLKRSGQNARIVLEHAILRIHGATCQGVVTSQKVWGVSR
ncbi:MAG TPA: DNA polymerase III subunit delta [Desulfobacterales bacterium]|nr:DNA polymerase III subunit delta [Desulfobacterales bacterium]